MTSIPFTVPTEFATGLADGSLLRFGALLKEADTGLIVGHLQETGIFQQAVHAAGNIPFSPLAAVTAGSTVYTNVQIHHLTGMVRSLQMFQYANLGVALVGVGVSVAGFVVLSRRLKRVEGAILDLRYEVANQFLESFNREFRARCERVECLLGQARIAKAYSSSGPELCRVAGDLADAGSGFSAEVKHCLSQRRIDDDALKSLVAGMMLCDSARIECLLLADELVAAKLTSEQVAENYSRWFDPVDPVTLTQRICNMEGEGQRMDQTRVSAIRRKRVEPLLQGLRDATDAALTKPFLVQTLIEQGITGPNYVERVQTEQEHPFLVLPHHRHG